MFHASRITDIVDQPHCHVGFRLSLV